MDRLQKKCFIGSTGFHVLLALILLVGPAFLTPKHVLDSTPILDFVPVVTTDAQMSGGGDRNVHSAPPAPPQPPAPQPQQAQARPEVTPEPETTKPAARQSNLEPETPDLTTEHQSHKIDVPTTPVTRKRASAPDATARSEREAREQARAQAEFRKRVAGEFNDAAKAIGNGTSAGTDIRLQGPGGGGLPYANWLQAVKSVYTREWIVPDGITDDEATTTASVTIARDGTVVSARITHSSGNSAADRSVQATLDRVTLAAPLPPGAKEEQRTVSINFNVRAKRSL
jgi:TonB family protein